MDGTASLGNREIAGMLRTNYSKDTVSGAAVQLNDAAMAGYFGNETIRLMKEIDEVIDSGRNSAGRLSRCLPVCAGWDGRHQVRAVAQAHREGTPTPSRAPCGYWRSSGRGPTAMAIRRTYLTATSCSTT
jgi:hypothetical protein